MYIELNMRFKDHPREPVSQQRRSEHVRKAHACPPYGGAARSVAAVAPQQRSKPVTAALQRAAHPGRALHASFERTREAARAAVRAPSSGSRWLSSAQRC